MFSYCSVLSVLRIIRGQGLYQYVFGKYFLPVSSLSFYSLMRCFCSIGFSDLNKVQIRIFFFSDRDYGFWVMSKKQLLNPRTPRFFSCAIPFRNCIIFHYTCKSMIYFKLVFAKKVEGCCLNWDFGIWISSCYSTIYWKEYIFFIENCLCSFVKDQFTVIAWDYFLALYSASVGYLPIFWPILHYHGHCNIVVSLEFG